MITISNDKHEKAYWLYLSLAFISTQFLFFIDEGYYDFRWMKDPGNWFVFIFYLMFLFIPQFIVHRLLSLVFSVKTTMLVICGVWCILLAGLVYKLFL